MSRRIALPGVIQEAPVDAALKDGVLTLRLKVPKAARPKQIEIKTAWRLEPVGVERPR